MTRKKPLLGCRLIACHKNKRSHEILANGKLPVFDNISDSEKKRPAGFWPHHWFLETALAMEEVALLFINSKYLHLWLKSNNPLSWICGCTKKSRHEIYKEVWPCWVAFKNKTERNNKKDQMSCKQYGHTIVSVYQYCGHTCCYV